MRTKGRYGALDIASFCFALCVVAIHTQPLIGAAGRVRNGYEFVVRLAVPFFFLRSGFFLFQRMEEALPSLARYTGKMARQYLLWTAVYLPIAIYGAVRNGGSLLAAAGKYVFQFLFVGEQFYSWPLWFLLALVYAGVFLWGLYRLGAKPGLVLALSLAVYLLSFVITYAALWATGSLGQAPAELSPVAQALWQLQNAPFEIGRVLVGMGYVPLGLVFARRERLLPRWAALAVLAASAALALRFGWFTDTPLLMLPAVALFDLLRNIRLGEGKLYAALHEASSWIYYLHMIVFFVYNLLLGSFEGDAQYGPVAFGVTLAGTLLLVAGILLLKPKRRA